MSHPQRSTGSAPTAGVPVRSPSPPRAALGILAALLPVLAAAAGCNSLLGGPGEGAGADPGRTSDDLGQAAPRTVASGLEVPWEIRFLPGGDLLVSERPGRLVRLSPDGERFRSDPVPGVVAIGESGLMGLALDPAFGDNRRIYVCYTTETDAGLLNRVDRFVYAEDGLEGPAPVLRGMGAARFHDGCRLEFGPEGSLFVTMGDAGNASSAQSSTSLNGKVLRITPDGEAHPDNPFDNPVHSLGHRNPQGLAFDDAGRTWITEHGPSGLRSGRDEINLVVAGSNYGWPEIRGDETASGMVSPVTHSGSDTWAPAGAAWHDGSLFFGGLRGESLYEAPIPADAIRPTATEALNVEVRAHFAGEYGRIRAVRRGPDGMLYFGTSNRDGRGDPGPEDDRILVVDPTALQ